MRGEDTLGGEGVGGSIVRKTQDTALYSIYVSTLWDEGSRDLKRHNHVHGSGACVHEYSASVPGSHNGASVHGTRNGASVHGTRNGASVHGIRNGASVNSTRTSRNGVWACVNYSTQCDWWTLKYEAWMYVIQEAFFTDVTFMNE